MRKMILAAAAFGAVMLAVACGGGISQSQDCKDYITCYEKTPGATKGSLDSTYGPMGTCWSTGVQATADSCTSTCKSEISTLKTDFPDAGC